ncbi:LOW QUALITY PROTEIN: claspin [Colossoma macropomum]|uniref:LOW QUALITY PROTEIN: claspin n=1 Tax=Colossoma macropomum TaxID=42526 RepID=UPI001864F516|nr:LOW QUALITY PROTEIN: claspin [Colossoma macropomum]
MSLLPSERPVDLPVESPKAESDSGDLDSGMGSPMEEAVTETVTATETQEDSDDEVAVNRKSRSVKVLQDSDSEREEEVTGMAEALILSESSGEETKTIKSKQNRKGRGKKISRISMGSDESEPERDEPKEVKKKREKSQRRKDKEERRGALMKRLKEKPGTAETSSLPKTLNDSGCLLGDNDLFDAQLEDDTADGEEEDEESLDAIRDAVKQRAKAKHKPHLHDFEDDEVDDEDKPQRKERKAAKASKEAMKQLHSDSQRLVRESTIGLPYHMPEPKGIDQFFKRRTRPQGHAMALLKSAEYQAYIMEASAAAPAKESQAKAPEQNTNLVADPCLDEPHPASCTQSEAMTNEEETHNAIGTTEDLPGIEASDELQSTEFMEEESAPPAVKVPVGSEAPTQDKEEPQVSIQQAESETGNSEQVGSSLAEPGPVMPKPKKDKLARLRELGLEPPPVAKLCADDGAFVQLEPPQANPALEALKERFLKHIQPAPRSTGERLLNINVVRKDSTPSGQEELHAESITITVNEGKEEPAHTKPGERLVLLKSELQKAMAIRRQEERERRAALYRLDNEDCEEEEEEEEMTESEEEGVDELLGDGEEENGGPGEEEEGEDEGGREEEEGDEGERDNAVEKSPPGLKSPSPTPYTDGTLMLFAGSSCSRTGDGVRQSGQAGQENDGKLEDEDAFSLTKESSHNSSFELIGSMLPSYQPVNRAAGRGLSAGAFRSPSPCLFRPSFLGSASKSSGKLSEPSLSLPVEDSQDLYAVPSPGDAGPVNDSQGPFSLEDDTHSQLLDADGFLNVGPRGGPSRSHKRQLLLDNLDENAMDANMGELLGLCSGGFGSGQSQPAASQSAAEDELLGLCSGAFTTQRGEAADRPREERRAIEVETRSGESHESSNGDMDQLLALCSGKFTGSQAASPGRSISSPALEDASDRVKKKEEEEEEEEEGNSEFRLLSDVDSLSEKEENEDEEDSDVEEDNDDEEREAVFGPRPGKRKIRMAEFVDSEAELSGSDVGSEDEDEEGGDEYEEEELQEELPSDEELMDQVNKIHMKQVLDDDKRKLRLYQEHYLADGDLHSDGPGRERRFRWKNMDDGFEFGVGAGDEEEEEDDEVDQSELQRRKERLEREQWMREQSEAQAKKGEDFEEEDEKIGEEDSQFMKLAKKLTAKTLGQRAPTAVPLQEKAAPNTNSFQKPYQPMVKRGSLLSQPRAVLQKLANISDSNPLAPRNTRGFLFQTLSPEKEPSASAGPKKQMKKRSQPESFTPVAKRPCRENSVKIPGPPRSVFSYLEN